MIKKWQPNNDLILAVGGSYQIAFSLKRALNLSYIFIYIYLYWLLIYILYICQYTEKRKNSMESQRLFYGLNRFGGGWEINKMNKLQLGRTNRMEAAVVTMVERPRASLTLSKDFGSFPQRSLSSSIMVESLYDLWEDFIMQPDLDGVMLSVLTILNWYKKLY